MSIPFKSPLKSSITNAAYMSRTAANTDTVSIVGLANTVPDSGNAIINLQKALNRLFVDGGLTGEADTTGRDYTEENYITDLDAWKTAIDKLDIALLDRQDNIDTLELQVDINTLIFNSDTPAAAGTLTPNISSNRHYVEVAGSGGAVTLANEPFNTAGGFLNGLTTTIVGLDSVNTVKITRQDIQYGALINGSITLGKGHSITLRYSTALERFIEEGRNEA